MVPYASYMVENHVPDAMKALSYVKSLVLFEAVAASHLPGLRSNDLNGICYVPQSDFIPEYSHWQTLVWSKNGAVDIF
jgi:hypothetical protein